VFGIRGGLRKLPLVAMLGEYRGHPGARHHPVSQCTGRRWPSSSHKRVEQHLGVLQLGAVWPLLPPTYALTARLLWWKGKDDSGKDNHEYLEVAP